jgi:hypothetical protein
VIREYLLAPDEITGDEVDATVNLETPQLSRDILSFIVNFLKAI